ncbi:beta-N-acetylglucosaminidase domain-containing protein [Actinosynnema sp. ALI-1.44]|uniref:beta-N-acetylglucosaminidase domain-containing protein n=1 Tax=Actinosynnema sp. ALI-1.44 TaxID=1933779 RepID=UPI00192CEE1D|nr:beta-N-acetylglucosaminidase domain-containing protein [Actinosynnema sp. ALI-1.44]
MEVRDWPSLRWRGVVEGFYGPPWTHEARLDSFGYFGRHKMNLYFYTPKDDPYLRAEWRQPYPADHLARLDELVKRAKDNHVEFGYVLSPGLSICYSGPSETDALIAKFTSLYRLGVRMFVVALDDIDHQRWNCDEDRAAFGTGLAAAASAQAHVINRVQREFVAANPGRATRPPADGEALTFTLPTARELDKIVVLADARAEVQVRAGDRGVPIGRLIGGYTPLPVRGLTTDTIRLKWATGSPPVVYEIVPHG